jgi:hypothetical protein
LAILAASKNVARVDLRSIIVLAAIVLAFALFAAVLAWEDYCAQLAHRIRDRDRKEAALTASPMALKNENKTAAASQARWPQPSDERLQHVA